jgi:hypothetical protein
MILKKPTCVHRGKQVRIAFVAKEDGQGGPFICDLHENKFGRGGDFWPHDVISVAVYFCKKCGEATAIFNRA